MFGQPSHAYLVEPVDIVHEEQRGRSDRGCGVAPAARRVTEQAGREVEHPGLLVGRPQAQVEAILAVCGRRRLEPHGLIGPGRHLVEQHRLAVPGPGLDDHVPGRGEYSVHQALSLHGPKHHEVTLPPDIPGDLTQVGPIWDHGRSSSRL